MKSRTIAIVVAVIVIAAAVGLAVSHKSPTTSTTTSSSNSNSNSNQTTSNATAVTIQGYAFSPSTITVKKGTTVTWTNKDAVEHDVASDTNSPQGGLAGPLLPQNNTYSFTFNTVGTYKYHCTPHPYMQATVIVTD